MGLIAFYNPKTGSYETLQEHLEGVAKEISVRFSTKRAKMLAKLLNHDVGVELGSINRMILYAGIFHDVGKAYDCFQESLRRRGTAPRHEDISVLFSDRVLVKMKKELKMIVLLAIAWHHYSTRGAIMERIAGSMGRFIKINCIKLRKDSRDELSVILENIFSSFECGEEVDLSNIPEEVSIGDVSNILNNLGRIVRMDKNNDYRMYRATLPILTALQIADAKVSSENRRTAPPIYIKDITNLYVQWKIAQTLRERLCSS